MDDLSVTVARAALDELRAVANDLQPEPAGRILAAIHILSTVLPQLKPGVYVNRATGTADTRKRRISADTASGELAKKLKPFVDALSARGVTEISQEEVLAFLHMKKPSTGALVELGKAMASLTWGAARRVIDRKKRVFYVHAAAK